MSKKIVISFLTIILLLTVGIYVYSYLLHSKEEANDTIKESDTELNNSVISSPYTVKENKYYTVYIKGENGSATSFVPLKLNPGFKNDSDYHITISLDDNGKITNGDKIIEIDHFTISNSNKEMIKKIAGTENYDEAVKEIEDRLIEIQKSAKIQ